MNQPRCLTRFVFAALCLALCLGTMPALAQRKGQTIAPPKAWEISDPLGLRYNSTIDTLFENYHATVVPSLASNAWATTGNYGTEGQNQIFFNRTATSDFFLADALEHWLPSVKTQRFYNTRVPMTLLSHTTGGDKNSNQDRTTAIFSGNAGRRFQAGGMMDYFYSKGSYNYQADKDFQWGLSGSYLGDRYELQTFFNSYNNLNKENGGITDDRYITDPATVQGGVTKVNPKDIPTRLSAAHSKLSGGQFYMNHRYKVGYYHYDRDPETDTITGKTYIPVTSFIWTLDYRQIKHRFINQSGYQDTTYFANTYLGLGGTDEATRLNSLRNTVGISLLEGFNKYAKFGFAVYATHELARYTQVTDSVSGTELPEGLTALPYTIGHRHTENRIWVGGELTKQHGAVLTYEAKAQFGVAGDVAADVDIEGSFRTRFALSDDSVAFRGYGYFKNLEAPYLLKNFVSNHYVWQNDFGKTQRLRLGAELLLPFSHTRANVGYETLKNYIFFNTAAVPEQCGSPMHVFSATVTQPLALGAFHFDNSVTYQTSSKKEVLPLPALALYSNLYVRFTVARVLHVQMGLDCNYYSRYHAPAYNPATMTFHNQDQMRCGDFAFMNAYVNCKMKQARFFLMYSHVNKGIWGGDNYFSIPHYPLNPGRFQIGVSVNFLN